MPVHLFFYNVAEPGMIRIAIVNIKGQLIRQLLHEEKLPGAYKVHWDGFSEPGVEASSGVYIVTFKANEFTQNMKILLIR